MNTQKAWCFVCLLFCVQSLITLFRESDEVSYKLMVREANDTDEDPIYYLACGNLTDFSTSLGVDLNETVDLTDLPGMLRRHFESNQIPSKELILKQTASRNYWIYQHMICWIANNKTDLAELCAVLQPGVRSFAFKNDTLDMIELPNEQNVHQLIVINPKSSRCYASYPKFHCLNDCFKQKSRSSRYFYSGNESGLVVLDTRKSRMISKDEELCFSKCEKENCKLVHLYLLNVKSQIPKMFVAYPFMSSLSFFIQLSGLLLSFAGTCLVDLTLRTASFINSKIGTEFKMKIRQKIKNPELYLRLAALLISLTALLGLYAHMITDFEYKRSHPIRKETRVNLFSAATTNLLFCLTVNNILLDVHKKVYLRKNLFANMTMLELERKTDGAFRMAIDDISLLYHGKSIRVHWNLKPNVLFKDHQTLLRCFWVEVRPREARYQQLLAMSVVRVKVNPRIVTNTWFLFLLVEGERFSFKSFELKGDFVFEKKVVKNSKWKRRDHCRDYLKETGGKCTKWQCQNICINRLLFESYRNITVGHRLVIEKSHFSDAEWATSYPRFEAVNYDKAKKACSALYFERECKDAKFERSVEISLPRGNDVLLPVYYELVRQVEEEPSLYKLVLYLLSVQSLLYGLNVFKLLTIASKWIQTRLQTGNRKLHLFSIYLLCSFGFTWHVWHIVDAILHESLTYSQHYEVATRIRAPEFVFCWTLDRRPDEHRKLTANYLEELTSHTTALNAFDRVYYLNASDHQWIELDRRSVATFYFTNKKCLRIETDQQYDRDRFHFATNAQILRVNFNMRFVGQRGSLDFMTRSGRMQFSKTIQLNKVHRYAIEQELFVFKQKDRLFFIKHPLLLFGGEDNLNSYLERLIHNEFQLRTLDLPLIDKDDREIRDDLFWQYYAQIVNISDQKAPRRPNYRAEFAINRCKSYPYGQKNLDTHFVFSLNYFKRVVEGTNDDNLGKLILNLLNVLSIWFNLDVPDLHVFGAKIGRWFLALYALLSRARRRLYRLRLRSSLY